MTESILVFERTDEGTIVATCSHGGRSLAAIVHPARQDREYRWVRPWSLAGDLAPGLRPCGEASDKHAAMREATRVLGDDFGIQLVYRFDG